MPMPSPLTVSADNEDVGFEAIFDKFLGRDPRCLAEIANF